VVVAKGSNTVQWPQRGQHCPGSLRVAEEAVTAAEGLTVGDVIASWEVRQTS